MHTSLRLSRVSSAVALPRLTATIALSLGVLACTTPERSLLSTDDHQHAPSHNLTGYGDSVYRWSDPSAWPNGQVPTADASVVIPFGRRVLLDVPVARLARLTILGALEFSDSLDLELSARAIEVQGEMRIGYADRRFQHRATITLIGSAAEDTRFGTSAKGIVVSGGTLEWHGVAAVSWTRLGVHASAGATSIELERSTDWKAGDFIALSATGFDPNESEDAEISRVEGARITLAQPLRYAHFGELQSIAGRTLDERAEVALLSRNIVVRGDAASDEAGYGAHVMIMPGSTAHIESTEFHRVGQRGAMGRYPLHWHLAKDTEGHYARDNTVWRSYNRCITIHGTNGVALEHNVCYDHLGHGFFLEDGIEHGNVLAGNIGFRTRAPSASARLLASDERPATFWITSPDNDLHDNVAAGSEGFGIWYSLSEYPTGMSATHAVSPRHTPLRTFDHNVAHSNVASGLWVDEAVDAQGKLNIAWYEPQRDAVSGTVAIASFARLIAWKNQALGAWFRGSDLRLVDAVLADNMSGAAFAAAHSTLDNAFVVGVSGNAGVNPGAWAPVRGFWFYDGPVGVRHSTFVNFDARAGDEASALGFHPVNPWPISADNWVEDVHFVDARRVMFDKVNASLDATKSAVVTDRDGSLSDTRDAVLVPDSPLLREGCSVRTEWRAWLCSQPFTQLLVRSAGALMGGVRVQRFATTESDVQVAAVRYDPTFTTLTVPLGVRLVLETPGSSPQQLSLTSSASDSTVLDITLPGWNGDVRIDQHGRTLLRAYGDALDDCESCWGEDPQSGALRLRVRAVTTLGAISLSIDRAPLTGRTLIGASTQSRVPVQREPSGRANSVLKYGSRAFNAKM